MKIAHAVNIEELRQEAKRYLPAMLFDFIDGGAEDEQGIARNRASFGAYRLLPRYLRDSSAASQSVTLFGRQYASPLSISNYSFNHFGRQLKAMFGSDLGHWDVPVMAKVVTEAYEMVENGMITPEDFRKFTFTNVAEMYTAMNPDFFKGTVVEKDCAAIGAKLA